MGGASCTPSVVGADRRGGYAARGLQHGLQQGSGFRASPLPQRACPFLRLQGSRPRGPTSAGTWVLVTQTHTSSVLSSSHIAAGDGQGAAAV